MPVSRVPKRVAEWRLEVGTRLRGLRAERSLSQERLAELAGVDRKLIYRTELGQTSPRLDAVALIAEALGVDLSDLVGTGLPPRRRGERRARAEETQPAARDIG
jgi:transcriptional regulator with XRE-family HTH domain